MALPVIALAILALRPAPGCPNSSLNTNLVREEGSIDTMGSLFAVVAYSHDGGEARAAISDALDEAARLDALLSN